MNYPPEWEDWDGRKFIQLATSKDKEILQRLQSKILQRLFPGQEWIGHLDDMQIHVNNCSLLLLAFEVWESLSEEERTRLVIYAEAFTDASGV